MATITSKEIIQQMLDNGGHYEDDPAPFAIFEYRTPEGATAWSVCYSEADAARTLESPFAYGARLIFGKLPNPFDFDLPEPAHCEKCGRKTENLRNVGSEEFPFFECFSCIHRLERAINTREMYGRGRRGY